MFTGNNLSCHVNNLCHYHRSSWIWIRQYELDTAMDYGFWSVPAEDMVDEVMDLDCLDNFYPINIICMMYIS